MDRLEIKTLREYELYIKQLVKNRVGEKPLEELLMKVFQDGINFQLGRLKVEQVEDLGLRDVQKGKDA